MRWFRLFLGSCAFAILAVVMSYVALHPGFTRCLLVDWYPMDELAPRLYVNRGMSVPERTALGQAHAQARARVREFFGSLQSDPVIIAGNNLAVIQQFGNAKAQTGMTHLSPLGGYIVLEKRGLNVDVLAHEMVHAELLARLG
jgi:hypothetical protein